MPAPQFVHLRLHTEFSVSDGIVRIDDVVSRAALDGATNTTIKKQRDRSNAPAASKCALSIGAQKEVRRVRWWKQSELAGK